MEETKVDYQNATVFDKLMEPVERIVSDQTKTLTPHHNEKFSFPDFFRLLIFFFVSGSKSAKLFINTSLNKGLLPQDLNLTKVPYSTFSDAFERFPPCLFRAVFVALLGAMTLYAVPELSALGLLVCVDGSLFPTLKSMDWAAYKKNANAVRLHLCFELNRMIPADVVVGAGKSGERDALRKMLAPGVTYIADRGYAGFQMFQDIVKAEAHFVIRVKENWLYTVLEDVAVNLPQSIVHLFFEVSDQVIRYDNDLTRGEWRLIKFNIRSESFFILTNRFDLTTFQIIAIYTYRWQVELFFRFLKRTMSGIHLIKNNENGVAIQFYAILIAALLQLKLKQDAIFQQDALEKTDKTNNYKECFDAEKPIKDVDHPYRFFEIIGKKLDKYWKLGIHWLTVLRHILHHPFDEHAIELLGGG